MLVSVLIPTRSGGRLLESVVEAVLEQEIDCAVELQLVDSGSPAAEVERLRATGASVASIAPAEFDHGATRDFAASLAAGELLVFLNQDALPASRSWLAELVRPLRESSSLAAVQGAICEFPGVQLAADGRRRFFWDSCGPRFYFTRESESWIERHGGIGFSTVNCAIARWAWRELPFGRVAILEDKLWQRGAAVRGWRIETASKAAVWHTHDYDLRGLLRRCASEGYGWRLLGERYSLGAALADLRSRAGWKEWRRGWMDGSMTTAAERLFPVARPIALWWGNHWSRGVSQ